MSLIIIIHVFFNVHRHVCVSAQKFWHEPVINGKYRKATCEQRQENYEWLGLRCH
jgi:hypothetical protein